MSKSSVDWRTSLLSLTVAEHPRRYRFGILTDVNMSSEHLQR